MKNITINPTNADDVSALGIVANETGLFPAEMLPDMVSGFLAGDPEVIWLSAHQHDAVIGFAFAVPEKLTNNTWNMLALAVLPSHQGDGVGTVLVKALEEALRQKNVRVLIADTSGSDQFALTRRFYAKNGYSEEARIRDFWDAGDDKIVFWKALL